MSKKITITALAAVLVLSMAAFAMAGQGMMNKGANGPGNGPRMQPNPFSQLTPEKQAEVKAVFDKYAPEFEKLGTAMWAKHATLQAMINGGKADEKAITKLVTDMSSLRDQMRDAREEMVTELTKATGIALPSDATFGPGFGSGCGACFGQGFGPGMGGHGNRPMAPGYGMMN